MGGNYIPKSYANHRGTKYVHIFDSFSAKLMNDYQKIFLHINCYPFTAGCLH